MIPLVKFNVNSQLQIAHKSLLLDIYVLNDERRYMRKNICGERNTVATSDIADSLKIEYVQRTNNP